MSNFATAVADAMESIKKNTDDWQKRMQALQEIQKQFKSLENSTTTVPVDTWRALKPLKDVIQDLRSQIVKEVCTTLAVMSSVTRDAMAPLARELLPVLVEVRGGGNKVCGAYCGECVEVLVTNIVTKGPTVRYFVDGVVESKNKVIRACCITALTLVLVNWSTVLDKSDVQQIEVGLKSALTDASATCRDLSLKFFQRFQQKFSKRAPALVASMDLKVQRRLTSLPLLDESATSNDLPPPLTHSNSNSIDENYGQEDKQVILTDSDGIDIGDRVCISEKELFGTVQYIGDVAGFAGPWVGIQLDVAHGKNDGSIKGHYYFRCKPQHGVFVRPSQIFLTKKRNVSFDFADDMNGPISEHDGDEEDGVNEAEAEDDTLQEAQPEDPPLKKLLDSVLDAQRGYLDFMFLNLNVEMDHLDVFQKSAEIASSADAVAYCDQVRNICQEKIDATSAFMEKIIEAQQLAMET
ncbi:unnamed protein product [Aphanomyces euteiches]